MRTLLQPFWDWNVHPPMIRVFHPDMRRTARTMLQFAGTDFIFFPDSCRANYDNMFAGSNFDAEDFDGIIT